MVDRSRPIPLQPQVHGTTPANMTTMQRQSGLPAPPFIGRPGGRSFVLPSIDTMQLPPHGQHPLPPIHLPPLGPPPRGYDGGPAHSRPQMMPLDSMLSQESSPMSTRTEQPQNAMRSYRPDVPLTTKHFAQPSLGPSHYAAASVYEQRHPSSANIAHKPVESDYSRAYLPRDDHRFSVAGISQSSSPSTRYYEEETSPRTPVPPPINTAPKLNYSLIIRQQPAAARACGFGERDRRVIDPPPILELRITDPETGAPKEDHPAMLALSCTLMTPDGKRDDTEVPGSEPNTQATRRLMGTLVASPYQAKDEHGVAGTFFVFPDLSCRSPGKYRLRWKLIRIDPTNMFPGQSSPAVANIMSDVFAVFTAKDFPGMRASSPLLKALRRQGLNVGVKKGSEARKGKGRTKKEESDSEDDDSEQSDAEGGASTTSRSTGGVSPKSKPNKKNVPKRKRRDS